MKILIIGGHLSPALSVIENIKNDEIFYVGRKYAIEGDKALSLEYTTIQDLKIPFFEITTGRLQRKFSKYTLLSLSKMPVGFFQAVKILKEIKPDVVLGFGGYVAVPVVVASFFLKIPVVLHEQTLEAGFSNKMLSKFAQKICISWESSRKFFPENKIVFTGIPIKKEIIEAVKLKKEKNKTSLLYITGGSLGSHSINSLVFKTLPKLLEKFTILHQTGDSKTFNDHESLESLKTSLSKEKSEKYILKKFLTTKEVVNAMANADIVVSRAGINTVCELIYLQVPSLLIPLSFSQRNEQLKNANFAKKLGLAEVSDEKLLDSQSFLSILFSMQAKLNSYKINNPDNILETQAPIKIIQVLKDVAAKKKAQ